MNNYHLKSLPVSLFEARHGQIDLLCSATWEFTLGVKSRSPKL